MRLEADSPRLAPPGAGLPVLELFFSRLLFAVARATHSRDSALRQFSGEARRIRVRIEPLDGPAGSQRVLVPRLLGLEDSSRFWSPFMVVEHLVIVDTNMFRIMTDLVAGRSHPDASRIENFKPSPSAARTSLAAFDQLAEQFESHVRQWPNLRTRCRHIHPWFGPLDAHGWLCLAGIHHAIHRRQLERILAVKARTTG